MRGSLPNNIIPITAVYGSVVIVERRPGEIIDAVAVYITSGDKAGGAVYLAARQALCRPLLFYKTA